MLKVEFHTHTSDDPVDRITHTATDLIDRAAALGYDAVAITLHERQLDLRPYASYAAERGIVLIPGVERTIKGKHVLLLNFERGAEDLRTFDDLAQLKRASLGVVVAPHPFFPAPTCLWSQLERHADLFDAVEYNAMFTRQLNFNRLAEQWAARHGKPMIGNCDVHHLRQLGSTYTLVDAERDAGAICAAVAAGRVSVVSRPLSWAEAAGIMAHLAGWRSRTGPQVHKTKASDSTNISLPQNV
jgi:predicted metal-dependent phosphoesterase TrpH